MNHSNDTSFNLRIIWQNILCRPLYWLVPTILVSVVVAGYAVFRSPTWEASQGLLVRDEAVGRAFATPGKFASVDDMKTAQETVLELATSACVVQAALEKVGPKDKAKPRPGWPTAKNVARLRGKISVKAPQGAEFGRTEVFYLVVKDSDRLRALQLATAISDALEYRLSQLRNAKAQSLIAELTKNSDLTHGRLQEATHRLGAMEAEIGSDLAELRVLNESASGESSLRRTLTNIRDELRNAKEVQLANQQLLDLLFKAQDHPAGLVAMPSQLLTSQPALSRLKDGLVDAQLRSSKALSLMSPLHPQVQAAVEEEKDVRRRLYGELEVAIRGLQVELKMNDQRIATLTQQFNQVQANMSKLASVRAVYNNLSAEVEQHANVWSKAQKDLADAQASQAAAHSTSLLTRLDKPNTGANPAGPSRAMIVLAGSFAGLILGLGLVVLTAGPLNVQANDQAAVSNSPPDSQQPDDLSQDTTITRVRNLSVKDTLQYLAMGIPTSTRV